MSSEFWYRGETFPIPQQHTDTAEQERKSVGLSVVFPPSYFVLRLVKPICLLPFSSIISIVVYLSVCSYSPMDLTVFSNELITLYWVTYFFLVRYYDRLTDTDVYRRGRPAWSRVRQRGTLRSWRRHRDETSSRAHIGTWRCCCTSLTSLMTAQRCRRHTADRSLPLHNKIAHY